MKAVNLKARVLIPLTLMSALVLTVFVAGLVVEENEQAAEDFRHNIESLQSYYHATLDEHRQKLAAALAIITAKNELYPAFKAGARATLLKQTTPLFQRLKAAYHITHCYFHRPDGTNLVRVHQPDRYGDVIKRYTLRAAQRHDTLSAGVELGPRGTLTLRVVAPVHQGRELLGYIELGEDMDYLVDDMAKVFGFKIFTVIDKRYLRRDAWEAGLHTPGHNDQWDYLPHRVVSSQTALPPAEIFRHMLRQVAAQPGPAISEPAWQHRHYRLGAVALDNAGGKTVGQLLLLRDTTARLNGDYLAIGGLSSFAVILAALTFTFIYWLLGRTEGEIRHNQTRLTESEEKMRLHYERTPLGVIEWDTDFKVSNWNSAAERIFGYGKAEALGRHATELIVPPSVRAEVAAVWQGLMSNHEVLHQINENHTKDSRIRLCEWYNTPLVDTHGEVIGVASLVDDITEQKQAERLSTRMGRILEHSWNEIYTFEADNLRFTDVSDGALQNLGYSLEELQRLTPLDIKPEISREHFAALTQPLREGKQTHVTFETFHQRQDGSRYPVEVRLQLSREESPPVFIAIVQDISERKRYIAELEHKALHDALTDLPNRILLQDRLKHALQIMRRQASPLALFSIDVIRLKEVNDILGHHSGDLVIREVARRLQQVLRESDTVARIGGDEFAIVLPAVDLAHVPVTAAKVQKLFEQSINIDDTPLEVEAAIGIALYPDHGDSPEQLLQHADIARHVAKYEASGFSIYTPEDDPYSLRRLKLHGALRQAIADKTLVLHYQPKLDLKTGRIGSVEALARWPHPTEGMIAPDDFIPMVEQSGLIRPFTAWVLEEAMQQMKRWQRNGIELCVAVNLSTRNLLDSHLPHTIAQLMQAYHVAPAQLTLEVTESAIMARPDSALKILDQLHRMGLMLSIDDFGTGYSSLAYLKKLPVKELKIDQSFVFGLLNNDNDAVIVRSTIDLAHNLGLHAVAEGVESQEVLDLLVLLDCDTAQGYHLSRPLPAAGLERWLQTRTNQQ
jgi:diguanylate cyclase (GGDEF)-like protein/PAS domain S-box-containing protein